MSHHDPVFDDRAYDRAIAYHLYVAAGITTAHGHLTAAALASDVADTEFQRAAEAGTARERRMFLHAANKARAARDGHELAAEITAIGEQVIGR